MTKMFFLITVLGIGVSSVASAGRIAAETQVTLSTHGQGLDAQVAVTNKGDEAALNVQIESEVASATQASPVVPRLDVNAVCRYRFHYSLKTLSPGQFPFIVKTMYADANLYPFSSVSVSTFRHEKDAPVDVLAILDKTEFQTTGHLQFRLKNLASQDRSITLRLVIPQELSVDAPLSSLPLSAHQEKTVVFTLHNFSALLGSQYSVFGLFEYDEGGLHYTGVSPGTILIRRTDSIYSRPLIPLAVVLLVVFIGLNVRTFYRRT